MSTLPLRPAPRKCPVCTGELFVERLRCPECESAVEGRFTTSGGWVQQLSSDQLAFVRVFLESRGKIKDVEAALGLSYPTVVSRLDGVVAAISGAAEPPPLPPPDRADRRREILDDLAAGLIDAAEAARRLKKA